MANQSQSSSGSSKGLGVTIDLQLGQLNDSVTTLVNALKQGADKASQMCSDAINKIWQQADKIRQSKQEGESMTPDVTKAYDRAISALRDAAKQGQQDAANALKKLGEKVEGMSSSSKSR